MNTEGFACQHFRVNGSVFNIACTKGNAVKDHKHNNSDLSSHQKENGWQAPTTITELDAVFSVLKTVGDRDDDGHLSGWREEQLRVIPAVTPEELEKKFDILESWVAPGCRGLHELDCQQVLAWVSSVRKDAISLVGEKS